MNAIARRLFTAFLGATAAVLAVCLLVDALGIGAQVVPAAWFDGLNIEGPREAELPGRVGWAVLSAGGLLVALWLVRAALERERATGSLPSGAIELWSSTGDVETRVSVARDTLARSLSRSATLDPSVRECVPTRVRLTRRGWDLRLELWVTDDAAMPAVSDRLQRAVGADLERFTGRPLASLALRHSHQPSGVASRPRRSRSRERAQLA